MKLIKEDKALVKEAQELWNSAYADMDTVGNKIDVNSYKI